MRLSIVLPCYNEARNLPLLVEAYREAWPRNPQAAAECELILVNNGSTDDTAPVLAALTAQPKYAFARVVTVERNRGYGHGIFTGLQAARGEWVAFSHADMQTPPQDVFAAFTAIRQQPEPTRVLVKGRRAPREWPAELVTRTMSVLATLVFATRLTDINAQPKLFHRSHLERLPHPPDGFQFDLYVLVAARRAGLAIRTIPVEFGRRAHGESKWAFSFLSRWRTIWRTITYMFELRLSQ
jgi:glycosyltransferase involved in cell wall biosynthesis